MGSIARRDCWSGKAQSIDLAVAADTVSDQVVIRGYDADASELVARYDALSTAEILAPVVDLLPSGPSRILDVGAGTGRDAAWFAAQGHQVTAVEPVEAFRSAGSALHPCGGIQWLDDRLPDLCAVSAIGLSFDFILLVGVWQHLTPDSQPVALKSLAGLLMSGGSLVISVRKGPGAASRPCYPADPDQLIEQAHRLRLELVRRRETPSIQPANRLAGVNWTWLCFSKRPGE